MRRSFTVIAAAAASLFIVACIAGPNTPTLAASDNSSSDALGAGPPRVIVVGTGSVTPGHLRSLVTRNGGVAHRDLGIINAVSATMPDQAAVARLGDAADVLRVDPDVVMFASAPPGACSPWPECKGGEEPPPDPEPSTQVTPWGVTSIGADQVWGTTTGVGVDVAVIDTGIDSRHPDLNVAGGINFTLAKGGKPGAWADDNGHGTHVAGTVAALDNTADVVGVAPDAALYAVKSLDRTGSGYLSDVIAGIDWSVANGMDVINMSLGATVDVPSLGDACANAEAAGLVVVAAAGNSGDGNPATDEVEYPGAYPSTIAVAAVDDTDLIAGFSSDGPAVEVAAPGVDVLSTYKGGGLAIGSGTSMASPHVAGAAALLLSAYPDADNACVRAALASSANDLGDPGRDVFYGYGLIDVPAALAAAALCP